VLSEAGVALNALRIRKDKFNNKNFTQAACVKKNLNEKNKY
jgi:hypothetical protein